MTPRRIGGSDIAALVGLSTRRRPIDVYRRLVDGHRTEATLAMRAGIALEPLVRELYAEATAEPLAGPRKVGRVDAPYAVGHLDDWRARSGEVVEYKTASLRMASAWGEEAAGAGGVPPEYLAQVSWYQWLAGSAAAEVAVLLGNEELRIYRLERDLELEGLLAEAGARFWRDHIEARRPPPPDGSDSYSDWVQRHLLSLAPTKAFVPPTPELEEQARRILDLDAQLEALGAERRLLRQRLELAIGAADGAEGDGWRVRVVRVRGREVTDWPAVAKAAGVSPALVAQHTARGAGHVQLRVTAPGPRAHQR